MATYQTLVDAITASTQGCGKEEGGFCSQGVPSSKGTIVYASYDVCSGSFINLPGINLLPTWLLAVMWGLFLMWLFFGVAVISDAFVEGIEVITSATKMYKRKDSHGRDVWREEPVWNWAVANITLLAAGSSSPEILLSLVDTLLTLDQHAGEIGPSTIIGSGAYNLFMILTVCTLSLPMGIFKRIKHTKVFWWTTSWSMWAHLWLWIVYKQVSPGVVEVWEAYLTLGFMPIFVITTYLVDTRGWNWLGAHKNSIVPDDDVEDGTAGGDGDSIVTAKASTNTQHHSILYYRAMAVQKMAGGGSAPAENRAADVEGRGSTSGDALKLDTYNVDTHIAKVLCKSPELSVLEASGEARVTVVRMHGDINSTLEVQYTCRDDTAVAGLDYEHAEGTLVFKPNVESMEIVVKIVDDDMSEPDVVFHVQLTSATVVGGSGEVRILRPSTSVTIVDDDDGGILVFELPTWEAGSADDYASVVVIRRNGSDGKVMVDYNTKDGTAVSGTHFKAASGQLVFQSGETRKVLQVPLLPSTSTDLLASIMAFRLVLSNPMGGVSLGARKECRVVIVPGSKLALGGGKGKAGMDFDSTGEVGDGKEVYDLWGEWEAKFQDAILPEFDADEGNVWVAMVLHYISITFKMLAACCPPAQWKGGYPQFFCAIAMLGGLMAIVKEVAAMFGCAVGLSDLMTGMSIVALGTSLPDTFASRYAALNDVGADAAIGNIMGSNSVNVFLGLGLPWAIASVYYEAKGEPYIVFAGALGFSIMIFFIFSAVALAVLMVRRNQGGELGGEKKGKYISAGIYTSLWLVFLMLSGLYDYGQIPDAGF